MSTATGTPCDETSDVFTFYRLTDNDTNSEYFSSNDTYAIKNADGDCVSNVHHDSLELVQCDFHDESQRWTLQKCDDYHILIQSNKDLKYLTGDDAQGDSATMGFDTDNYAVWKLTYQNK
jgi:hypothetical protein